jgi:hypothetical protein
MTVHIITADILKTILKTFETFQKSMKSLSEETLPQGKYFLNVSIGSPFVSDKHQSKKDLQNVFRGFGQKIPFRKY